MVVYCLWYFAETFNIRIQDCNKKKLVPVSVAQQSAINDSKHSLNGQSIHSCDWNSILFEFETYIRLLQTI